jgi:hypothetical protein
MLDGSKFGKRCLLGICIQNFFFDLENSKFSSRKSVKVRLGTSERAKILHELALLGLNRKMFTQIWIFLEFALECF